jgi:4-hydroxybenzoyl-CoA reductase subunit beta
MLPLPPFSLHTPASVDEAAKLLHDLGPGAQVIAGGTDLVPNMKQGMTTPRAVVSLQSVRALRGIDQATDSVRIGAMTTLETVATDRQLQADFPVLTQAAEAVGGPLHRRMGTLGGNVCLDTRCRYINQTHFWREALGYCLKRDGTRCHVVPGGQNCVAAASNDTATALIALDATLELTSVRGARSVPIRSFYTTDGVRNHVREDDEILVAVHVPKVAGQHSAYEKLRVRHAIDFPLLSVAVRADLNGDRLGRLEVVVSALAARPRRLAAAQKIAAGASLDEGLIDAMAKAASRECRPLANIDGDEEWRHDMVPVLVRRALSRLM